MKNKDKVPVPGGPLAELPRVTIQLPIYNEMYVADRLIDAVCQIDYPRELLEIQVLDDSTDETTSVAELRRAPQRGAGASTSRYHPPHRSHRLQGRRARGRAARSPRASSSPSSTPTSSRPPTSCSATVPLLRRPEDRDGAGALGAHQPGLLAAHEDPVDPARRALRARARRPQPRRAASSTSTARPASGAARRSPMPAAGSTTR